MKILAHCSLPNSPHKLSLQILTVVEGRQLQCISSQKTCCGLANFEKHNFNQIHCVIQDFNFQFAFSNPFVIGRCREWTDSARRSNTRCMQSPSHSFLAVLGELEFKLSRLLQNRLGRSYKTIHASSLYDSQIQAPVHLFQSDKPTNSART